MIHKVMTSWDFPNFAIPPKVYKKSEAVVMWVSEADKTGIQIEEEQNYIKVRFR